MFFDAFIQFLIDTKKVTTEGLMCTWSNKKFYQQTGKARSRSSTLHRLALCSQGSSLALARLESLYGCRWLHLASLAASSHKSGSESTHSPHPAVEGEAAKVPGSQGWPDHSTNPLQHKLPHWAHPPPEANLIWIQGSCLRIEAWLQSLHIQNVQ